MRVKPQAPTASLESAGSELFIATSQFIRIMGNLAFVLDILCRFFEEYRIHVEFKGDPSKIGGPCNTFNRKIANWLKTFRFDL